MTNEKHATIYQGLFDRITGKKSDEPSPYHAFTTQYDQVVDALDLDRAIGALVREEIVQFERASREFETLILQWKMRVLLTAAEISVRVREAIPPDERADTVVTFLFDQSGSMRGQKMLFAAAAADIGQEFLRNLGVKAEVLGFTTSRWRGGRSRRLWKLRMSPRNPGRLNDLLHIVYRDADDLRVSTGGPAFRMMLRPDLPKENVDGEAIQWAAARLRTRSESRKILIVISDGAPVDDSTLMENSADYLWEHLKQVVRTVQGYDDVTLGAVGLGFDVSQIYDTTCHSESPDQVGVTMLEFVEHLLTRRSV